MKKSFILTIFIVNISIFAQPVLNATDIISNFSATTYNANPANFSVGSSGADQVWDFSTIANVPKGTYTSVSSQNTPFVNSFSNPNYFLKATSSTPDIYEIYNLSTTKYETLGQSYDAGVIVNFSPNPFTVFEFPFIYNTIINDTYATTTNSNPVAFSINYDAYGTIKTPFGIYNNVIRRKMITGTRLNYLWFGVNPYRPILEYIFISSTNSQVTIFQPNNLVTSQNQLSQNIKISPNPNNGNFKINLDNSLNENFGFEIYNILGERVHSETINQNQNEIKTNNLSKGVYLVKISKNDAVWNGKILVE